MDMEEIPTKGKRSQASKTPSTTRPPSSMATPSKKGMLTAQATPQIRRRPKLILTPTVQEDAANESSEQVFSEENVEPQQRQSRGKNKDRDRRGNSKPAQLPGSTIDRIVAEVGDLKPETELKHGPKLTTDQIMTKVKLNFEPNELRGNPYDQSANTVHEPLVDKRDEDMRLPGIDNTDSEDAIERGSKADLEEGYQQNLKYTQVASGVKTLYPYARLRPGPKAPLQKVIQGALATRQRSSNGLVDMLIKKKRQSNPDKAKSIRSSRRKIQALLKEDEDKSRPRQSKLSADLLRNTEDCLSVVKMFARGRVKKQDLRKTLSSSYYLPKSCTKKAMAMLVNASISFFLNPESKEPRYHIPSRQELEDMCKDMSDGDIEVMEAQVRKGVLFKAVRALNSLKNTSGNSSAANIHQLNDYYSEVDTKKARKYIRDQNLDDIIEADDDDDDDDGVPARDMFDDEDEEKELEEDVENIQLLLQRGSDCNHMMPFRYSLRFTYKVLYYAYLNQYGYILPFGRTLPDYTWLYIFGLYIDSTNSLGLRMDTTQYALKLGGIGLVEKHLIGEKPIPIEFQKLFISSMNKGDGVSSFSSCVVGVYTALTQLSSLREKYGDLIDHKEQLVQELKEHLQEYNDLVKKGRLTRNIGLEQLYKEYKSTLRELIGDSADPSKVDNYILSKYNLEASTEKPSINLIIAPLSYEAAHMVMTMKKYARLWDNKDTIGEAWFIMGIIKDATEKGGYFTVVKEIIESERFTNLAEKLVGNRKEVMELRSKLRQAQEIANNDEQRSSRAMSLLSSAGVDLNEVWSTTDAAIIANSNQTLSSLIMKSLRLESNTVKEPTEEEELVLNESFLQIEPEALVKRNPETKSTSSRIIELPINLKLMTLEEFINLFTNKVEIDKTSDRIRNQMSSFSKSWRKKVLMQLTYKLAMAGKELAPDIVKDDDVRKLMTDATALAVPFDSKKKALVAYLRKICGKLIDIKGNRNITVLIRIFFIAIRALK